MVSYVSLPFVLLNKFVLAAFLLMCCDWCCLWCVFIVLQFTITLELSWSASNWSKLVSFSFHFFSLFCSLYILPHSSSSWLLFVSDLSPSFRCTSWLRNSSRMGSQFALRARTALASLHETWCTRGSWWILMILKAPKGSNCPCFNSTSRCVCVCVCVCFLHIFVYMWDVSQWYCITSRVSLYFHIQRFYVFETLFL